MNPPAPLDGADEAARDPAPIDAPAVPHPPIRSFVPHRSHMGPQRRAAMARLGPRYALPFQDAPIDPSVVFGNHHPVVLEIGCGMGETTAAIAAANPAVNYLGIEVYEAGVGALLARIDAGGLANLRVIQHDAVPVLERMIRPQSLAAIHVFFPDPWPKKRHHKRRLIQPPFVALAASRLAPGGLLHCATDWPEYADQMLEVLSANPLLTNSVQGFAQRPAERPVTKFERRGLALGHPVHDLIFERR